jgi:hypothetical protein
MDLGSGRAINLRPLREAALGEGNCRRSRVEDRFLLTDDTESSLYNCGMLSPCDQPPNLHPFAKKLVSEGLHRTLAEAPTALSLHHLPGLHEMAESLCLSNDHIFASMIS